MSTQNAEPVTPAKKSFLARNALVLICAVMAVVAIIGSAISIEQANSRIESSKGVLEQEKTEVTTTQEESREAQVEVVKDTSGVDLERKLVDDETASTLMGLATTWSSGEQYNKNRATIIDRYGIAENSAFLSTFMPDQRCRETTDGTELCLIDTDDLELRFVRMESSIIDVKGGTYTYFAIATVSAPSTDGSSSVNTENPIIYTTDVDGKITTITPYAVSGNASGQQGPI